MRPRSFAAAAVTLCFFQKGTSLPQPPLHCMCGLAESPELRDLFPVHHATQFRASSTQGQGYKELISGQELMDRPKKYSACAVCIPPVYLFTFTASPPLGGVGNLDGGDRSEKARECGNIMSIRQAFLWQQVCDIVGQELEFDAEATIFDLDMSEEHIAELIDRLECTFGITLDDVIARPLFSAIASHLPVDISATAVPATTPPPPLGSPVTTVATNFATPPPPPPPPPPLPPPGSPVAADLVSPGGLVRSTSQYSLDLDASCALASAPVRPSLSYNENLGVGIIGGCVETAALMPVLTWKFCVQEGRPLPPFPSWAWYRGVAVLAGSVAPLTGIQMFFNGVFEGLLTGGQRRNPSDSEVVGCALGAGALSAALYGPVEMTTIHQQKTGLGPLGTISHLVKTHGATSLWRGVIPTACREAIYTAGYLGLAPIFSAKLMQQPGWENRYLSSAILGSCAAGVLANAASHPIDTAKTVIQADVAGATYGGMITTLPTLYRSSGIARLYAGGVARTVRTCGAFFVVSTMRERFIQYRAAQDRAAQSDFCA